MTPTLEEAKRIKDLEKAQQTEKNIYKSVFMSDNGEKVIKYLETYVMHKAPFSDFDADIGQDALMREGARILLTHIKLMSEDYN